MHGNMERSPLAVLVIDVQRYYTESTSPLVTFTEARYSGSTRYLLNRLDTAVIHNIGAILASARELDIPIIYARLCGTAPDRSDLHQHFRDFDQMACLEAKTHVYPLASEPLADIDQRIRPFPCDTVIDKTGYSAFHGTGLHEVLQSKGRSQLVLTGLTTSQCVNSTARAAADYGYKTLMVEDAQADYDRRDHQAALYASEPITGRAVSTSDVLSLLSSNATLP